MYGTIAPILITRRQEVKITDVHYLWVYYAEQELHRPDEKYRVLLQNVAKSIQTCTAQERQETPGDDKYQFL